MFSMTTLCCPKNKRQQQQRFPEIIIILYNIIGHCSYNSIAFFGIYSHHEQFLCWSMLVSSFKFLRVSGMKPSWFRLTRWNRIILTQESQSANLTTEKPLVTLRYIEMVLITFRPFLSYILKSVQRFQRLDTFSMKQRHFWSFNLYYDQQLFYFS